jgi:hypothetical protein
MPNTYVLIASSTVGAGGAATISFTSIPSSYSDLVLKVSARTNTARDSSGYYYQITVNGSTADQATRYINGNGTGISTNSFSRLFGYAVPSDYTSSTFSSDDWYFSNYAGSTSKSATAEITNENNSTLSDMNLLAGLWSQSAAISSISIAPAGGSFVQYSTASLYGIKNS